MGHTNKIYYFGKELKVVHIFTEEYKNKYSNWDNEAEAMVERANRYGKMATCIHKEGKTFIYTN